MTFTFRPAIRESVPLIVGLAGSSGSGKTFSALRIAKGMSSGKRFALIDTEAGRAKHYADQFEFDHGDLSAPFSPQRYVEAIQAANDANYPVIVVDSMSHEWSGDGGCLDMQEAEFQRMGSRDTVKMASWIKPKGEHKAMLTKLLQLRSHLILCFRAEYKISMGKDEHGKTKVGEKTGPMVLDGWTMISEKNLPYELTLGLLLMADKPGIPRPIKLQEQHRSMVPLNKPIDESTGAALAAWSAGAKSTPPLKPVSVPVPATPDVGQQPDLAGGRSNVDQPAPKPVVETIPTSEAEALYGAANKIGAIAEMSNWLKSIGVARFRDIPIDRLDEAWELLKGIETR